MFYSKYLIALLIISAPLGYAEEGWVKVPRPERAAHPYQEEDPSIWVVFAKTFGPERILVRFPEDPAYRYDGGNFAASSSHYGWGEMSLTVHPRSAESGTARWEGEVSYRDADSGRLIMEKHITTGHNEYVLRFEHPTESRALFRQFVDSFDIQI